MTFRIKITTCLIMIAIFTLTSNPALAILPPDETQAEWLRNSSDLQDRILWAEETLKPLLYPETITRDDFADELGADIIENFGITKDGDSYIGRIDANNDGVIDERDFLELAFVDSIPERNGNAPKEGISTMPIFLIKFPDVTHQPETTPAYIEDYLFADDHYSAQTYYLEVSHGILEIHGKVLTNPGQSDGYWLADHNKYYYDGMGLLEEILNKADVYYDFTEYDADGDNEVDGSIFLYSGDHDEWGDFYWGWAGYGGWLVDGIILGSLMFTGEFNTDPTTVIHEYGHMMGLPDLYDYTFQSNGVGKFCMMSYTGANYMSAWVRTTLGWDVPITIQIDSFDLPVSPRSQGGPVYRFWHQGEGGLEYFLMEGIDQNGEDSGSPGVGIAIYHIDESIHGNSNWIHKQVDVEEADGLNQLDYKWNFGDKWDLYGVEESTFNSSTDPNSDAYDGWETDAQALNVTDTTVDLLVGLQEIQPVDEIEPNDNFDDIGVMGIPAPNEIPDGLIGFDSDGSDFWTIETNGPSLIDIKLHGYTESINIGLRLWDTDGNSILYEVDGWTSDEHIRTNVDGAGTYFVEVHTAEGYTYYEMLAEIIPYGSAGEIKVLFSDILPEKIYDNSIGIPALKIELLNNAGAVQLEELRAYYQGANAPILGGISIWIDDGDNQFRPGLDLMISHPAPPPQSNLAVKEGLDTALDGYSVLYLTVDLLDGDSGEQFAVGLQSYKDISLSQGDLRYEDFPFTTDVSYVVDSMMPLCYVPAGDFTMGTNPAEDPYFEYGKEMYYERPQHLHPTGSFYISRYETTCSQWIEFMAAGGYSNSFYWDFGWDFIVTESITEPDGWGENYNGPDYPNYPVGGLCWYEAMAYAKYIGGRLPTEAEWEKTARGATPRIFTWGDVYDNTKFNSGWPIEVGSKPESDSIYGASDLIGNIIEWTRDDFEFYTYSRYANGDFTPPPENDWHMIRGLGYDVVDGQEDSHWARAAFRFPGYNEFRWTLTGFRVAFDEPE